MSAAPNIVKAQQAYATSQKLAKLFEDLTTALIYSRPADPAAFISAEVVRMAKEGEAYRAKPLNGVVDTEESAAAYWEDERVRALLEVRRGEGARSTRTRISRTHQPLSLCARNTRTDISRRSSLRCSCTANQTTPMPFCGTKA